jgi:hypothetical protein
VKAVGRVAVSVAVAAAFLGRSPITLSSRFARTQKGRKASPPRPVSATPGLTRGGSAQFFIVPVMYQSSVAMSSFLYQIGDDPIALAGMRLIQRKVGGAFRRSGRSAAGIYRRATMAKTLAGFTVSRSGEDYVITIEEEGGETQEYSATYDQLDLIADTVGETLDADEEDALAVDGDVEDKD